MKRTVAILIALFLVLVAVGAIAYTAYGPVHIPPKTSPTKTPSILEGFSLPKGFHVSVFADDVPDARVIAFGPSGELLVSEPAEGKIIALADTDGDGVAETRTVVVAHLDAPHGLAFQCATVADNTSCRLFVAEKDMLSVFNYDTAAMRAANRTKLLDLPTGGTHTTRSILFLPYPNQNTLLISIGSSCNVCDEENPMRAKVMAYNVVTGELSEYARGLRNSVFMDINPVSGDVWATEMGRDGLGDDTPPDEINILAEGANYGWPVCYGKNIHDDQFDTKVYFRNPCMEPFETPSYIDIPAHSAPLGIAFIPEEGWPEDMWYDALVAYHGSWNRSVPTGYKIVRMMFDAKGTYKGTEDFMTGWLRPDGSKVGRPADIKVLSGGVMFVTDDDAGVVYRISRD